MNTRHILLTTDFSDESKRAFAPVIELAKSSGAKVTLFHAIENLSSLPYGYAYVPALDLPGLAELESRARNHLEQWREELDADLDIHVEVVSGERVDEVVTSYAKMNDVDLIALSSHGRSGLRRLFLGSVAEAILRSAQIPVLVFPPAPA